MTDPSPPTVVFPLSTDGRRGTSPLGRAVVADALRAADPVAADAAAREPDWRRGYLPHFRALVAVGSGYAVADAGLASLHARMRVTHPDGDVGLDEVFSLPVDRPLQTLTVDGSGTPERELALPYRGALLRGTALDRCLDAWVAAGTIEPSCAAAVREVAANPDWLDLSDQRLVVLGAGSEMGPLRPVLRWGGTVVGVDLPQPGLWSRLTDVAARSAGRLLAPVWSPTAAPDEAGAGHARVTGADLLTGLPAIAEWLLGIDGRLVLGTYCYADGATHVRLSAATDALGARIRRDRPDTALAYLATPTDVFTVPADAVAESIAAYRAAALRRRPLQLLSGGRLLQPNYGDTAVTEQAAVNDSLVPQQGPNYALAKRIQRWRATAARRDGATVSIAVAPPTRTRSVLRNRALAAAYAGARHFGVEVFEPATSNTLMAALLVHQLRNPRPAGPDPATDEAWGAAHGGLWRIPYQPRSALGLAAVLGLPFAWR